MLLTSATIIFPIHGNIPFISLLRLAINISKKAGANVVLALLYRFDFIICAIEEEQENTKINIIKRYDFKMMI